MSTETLCLLSQELTGWEVNHFGISMFWPYLSEPCSLYIRNPSNSSKTQWFGLAVSAIWRFSWPPKALQGWSFHITPKIEQNQTDLASAWATYAAIPLNKILGSSISVWIESNNPLHRCCIVMIHAPTRLHTPTTDGALQLSQLSALSEGKFHPWCSCCHDSPHVPVRNEIMERRHFFECVTSSTAQGGGGSFRIGNL